MTQKVVRLVDIARSARVSVPTVSQVLTGRARAKRISVRLEKKILAIANRMGYRPNLMARALRCQKSMTVGVLVANLGESFYPAVMARFHQQIRKHGYLLLFSNHYLDSKLFHEEARALLQRSVDALVLGPVLETGSSIREIRIIMSFCPVLAFDWSHPLLDSVLNGPETLGKAAADYLLQKGSRKVLAVSLNEDGGLLHALPFVLEERLRCFQERFATRSGNSVVIWRATSGEQLAERVRMGFAAGELSECDGVFFPHTTPAEHFLAELLYAKLDLLQRAPLIAISGDPSRFYLRRHMALLYQNPMTIGDRLAERLLARIKDRHLQPQAIDVPPEFIDRG